MMWYIYVVAHRETGRCYIGKASDFKKRWRYHRYQANHDSNVYFHAALRKYGFDAFEWKIVQTHDTEEQSLRAEEELIAEWRELGIPLYNLTSGGDGQSGYRHTEETKKKISDAKRGRKHTDEARTKMSVAKLGKPGHVMTEEINQKISATKKKRFLESKS